MADDKKRRLALRRAGRAATKAKPATTFADRRDQERKLGLKRRKKK